MKCRGDVEQCEIYLQEAKINLFKCALDVLFRAVKFVVKKQCRGPELNIIIEVSLFAPCGCQFQVVITGFI